MRDALIGILALACMIGAWLLAWLAVYAPALLSAWSGSSFWMWVYPVELLAAAGVLGRWIRRL